MSLARCTGYYPCDTIIDTDSEPESCDYDDRILCYRCREGISEDCARILINEGKIRLEEA